jgi:membrane-associated phospholipid phosphatase
MMTLMNMIIAFKLRSSLRWIFFFMGISLIFATIYLRYHYVVDVLFGIVFAFLALWLEPKCYRLLLRYNLIKK